MRPSPTNDFFQRILFVHNPRAGSAEIVTEAQVQAILRSLGCSATVTETVDLSKAPLSDDNIKRADLLVVSGGDGTLSAILAQVGTKKPVLPLPGGTMNILYKDWIGDPANWRAHLQAAMTGGREREISAATANGHHFFLAAAFGPLTRLADAREALRDGEPLKALSNLADTPVFDLQPRFAMRPANSASKPTPAMAIGCVLEAENHQPRLAVGELHARSFAELSATAFAAVLDDWKRTQAIGVQHCAAFVVETLSADQSSVRAILDGEPIELKLPVSVELRENKARILCPK